MGIIINTCTLNRILIQGTIFSKYPQKKMNVLILDGEKIK